jgi:hypothetical protein
MISRSGCITYRVTVDKQYEKYNRQNNYCIRIYKSDILPVIQHFSKIIHFNIKRKKNIFCSLHFQNDKINLVLQIGPMTTFSDK